MLRAVDSVIVATEIDARNAADRRIASHHDLFEMITIRIPCGVVHDGARTIRAVALDVERFLAHGRTLTAGTVVDIELARAVHGNRATRTKHIGRRHAELEGAARDGNRDVGGKRPGIPRELARTVDGERDVAGKDEARRLEEVRPRAKREADFTACGR